MLGREGDEMGGCTEGTMLIARDELLGGGGRGESNN